MASADYCEKCRRACGVHRPFAADEYEDDGRGGIRIVKRNPRRRRNLPIIGRRNPSRRAHVVAMIPGRTTEIRYIREGEHSGPYKHAFSRATDVRQYAMSDGSVLLKGKRRIHADDRRPGFEKYTHGGNPTMATRKDDTSVLWWVLIGGLAYWMITQAQGQRAGTTGSPLPSGGSSTTSPDILGGSYYPPSGVSSDVPVGIWYPPMLLPEGSSGLIL